MNFLKSKYAGIIALTALVVTLVVTIASYEQRIAQAEAKELETCTFVLGLVVGNFELSELVCLEVIEGLNEQRGSK